MDFARTICRECSAIGGILRAELRTVHRSAAMRVYAVAAIGGVGASLLVSSYWHGVMSGFGPLTFNIAPPYLLSWYGAPLLYPALAFMVASAAAASGRDRDPVFAALLARPFSTAALQIGRLLALGVACWWPLAVSLAAVQCVGAVGSVLEAPWRDTMRADAVLAFLLLDVPAALALFGGATTLLAAATRSRAAAAVCGLALAAGHAWALLATPSHLLPVIGLTSHFAELPSDFLATIDAETFLRRTATAIAAAGLLTLGVCCHSRPAFRRRQALALGMALLIAGLAVPAVTAHKAIDRLALRQEWRSVHVETLGAPAADAAIERVEGSVRIAPGHAVDVDVKLELRLAPESRGPLRFSFNPGMTVRELRLADKPAAYTHQSGLLTVRQAAGAASQVSMRLRATGTPVSDFAYLDSPLEWRALPFDHPLLWLGKDAIINEKGLVALMPGARWLPAPGVNVGTPRQDPFLLDLTVEAPPGWLVAGPGRRQLSGEHFRFAPASPVADVALVAGPYEQHAVTVADVQVELLAAPGHTDRVGGLVTAEALATRFREILDRLAMLGLDYPYKGLTVVEVPMRLRTYGDGWRMAGLALSGVLLLREAHLTTPVFHAGPPELPPRERLPWLEHYFAPGADLDGGHPLVALARQAFALQVAAEGPGALALGFILNDLAAQTLAPNQIADRFSGLRFVNTAGPQTAILHRIISARWGADNTLGGRFGDLVAAWAALPLSNRWVPPQAAEGKDESAWDAAHVALAALDDCASAHMRRRGREGRGEMPNAAATPPAPAHAADVGPCTPVADAVSIPAALDLKGSAAATELMHALGAERAAALLAEVRRRHAGGRYRAEDVAAAEPSGAAGDLLDHWLNTSGLPGFVASAATVARLPNGSDGAPRYQTRVHVFNAEPVDGTLHLSVGGPPPRERADGNIVMTVTGALVFDRSPTVRVVGNTAAEIGLVTAFRPEQVSLTPSLSRNRDEVRVALPEWAEDIVDAAPLIGGRPSNWRPAPIAGIVVDDLDAGFAVAPMANAQRGVLAPPSWLPAYSLIDPPRWSRLRWATAWGKYRRTVARTLAGDGGNAAVFRTQLPAPGRWRLHYHWPEWRPVTVQPGQPAIFAIGQQRYYDKQGPYGMRVITAAGAEAVDFSGAQAEAGWNTIGDFHLPAGEVRVVVSNETPGESVIADAIRWLRLDAPDDPP